MIKNERIKCHCSNCQSTTWHVVLETAKHCWATDDKEIEGEDVYSIIQCCGCDTMSYRTESTFSEDIIYLEDGSFEYNVSVESYPAACVGIGSIEDIYLIPYKVRNIYMQTLHAVANKDYLIAGMGLRSVIESVCLVEAIAGKNLKSKIDKMVSNGFLSKTDAKMLQGIRFLGNDAVHDLDEPKLITIVTATKIVEHLLITKYVLPQKGSKVLDLPVETYLEFKELVQSKIQCLEGTSCFTLKKLLGKDYRRIDPKQIEWFVKNLNGEIDNLKCRGIGYRNIQSNSDAGNEQEDSKLLEQVYFRI